MFLKNLREIGGNLFTKPWLHAWDWRDAKDGVRAIAWALSVVLLRLVLMLTCFVSVPLLAWFVTRADAKTAEHWEDV